uniref:Uncharacterized protein n=1 Tax=Arundo donax TaxID=35708 RepID=A0A0A8ZAN1_ARUDO
MTESALLACSSQQMPSCCCCSHSGVFSGSVQLQNLLPGFARVVSVQKRCTTMLRARYAVKATDLDWLLQVAIDLYSLARCHLEEE